jgi:hypothetical protein
VSVLSSRDRATAVELFDLLDVVLHRLVLAHALELAPRVVFRAADEVESARTIALHIAVGRLLVVRIELEQGRVIGFLLRLLGCGRGGLKRGFEIFRCGGHASSSRHDGIVGIGPAIMLL